MKEDFSFPLSIFFGLSLIIKFDISLKSLKGFLIFHPSLARASFWHERKFISNFNGKTLRFNSEEIYISREKLLMKRREINFFCWEILCWKENSLVSKVCFNFYFLIALLSRAIFSCAIFIKHKLLCQWRSDELQFVWNCCVNGALMNCVCFPFPCKMNNER